MHLATAHLEPALRVSVPETYSDVDAALAYWLSNPLLPAKRVAATKERLPLLAKYEKHALVLRLKQALQGLRAMEQNEWATGYNRLLDLVRHELVTSQERVDLKPHFIKLRGREIEWEYTRLAEVIRLREYAANEHADVA